MAEEPDTTEHKPARGKVKLAVGFPAESHTHSDGETVITSEGTEVPSADADSIIEAAAANGVTIRKV